MTTKADYTEDEWAGLVRAPILAGAYVAASDMSFFGMIGEMTALYKTMTEGNVPEAASGLIEAVVAEIEDSKDAKEKLKLPETKQSATQAAQLVHQLGLDLEVLDQKSTPEETRAFKDWLIQIAQATAEATKEGGFLGIGAVRVSDKEQMALATLRHELGIG
jgi:putative Ca2+/H+ antiporter (TMEM165/GDT1 family)